VDSPGRQFEGHAAGTLQTDPATMATSRPDVFAGGDVAFGPRIIITAVAEGKKAAAKPSRSFSPGSVPAEPRQARVTIYDTLHTP
jgi:thioredoxin reductase